MDSLDQSPTWRPRPPGVLVSSLPLADPAGNSIELATAAVWGLAETSGTGGTTPPPEEGAGR